MGVNISKLIPKKEIELSDLKGKVIAIDAYVTLYQFLTTIRQPDGTPLKDSKGNITSHLSGLFYRNLNLLQEQIKPIYIFDGTPPEQKLQELKKRKETKQLAEQKYQTAKQQDDIQAMKKYASRTVKITDEIIEQSKQLLEALGIPCVQAPSEGEAESSLLAKTGQAYASASQDYDSLLYATPKLIRNLTSPKRKKLKSGLYQEIKPELIEFDEVLKTLNINHDQLIALAILVGTDYNPGGVKGLGQKRALEIAQQNKTPEEIFKTVSEKYEVNFDWQEILNLFKNYKTSQIEEIKLQKPDKTKIKQLLSKYEFSEARIESGLQKLQDLEDSKKQKGLSDFF
jgi:flap endonuclease-1